MIAELPPIPQCVENISDVKSQSIIFVGKNVAIRSLLDDEQVKAGPFEISLSQVNDEGNVTAILRLDVNTPYRKLGGLIYTAQRAGLTVSAFTFQPPLCKPNNNLP